MIQPCHRPLELSLELTKASGAQGEPGLFEAPPVREQTGKLRPREAQSAQRARRFPAARRCAGWLGARPGLRLPTSPGGGGLKGRGRRWPSPRLAPPPPAPGPARQRERRHGGHRGAAVRARRGPQRQRLQGEPAGRGADLPPGRLFRSGPRRSPLPVPPASRPCAARDRGRRGVGLSPALATPPGTDPGCPRSGPAREDPGRPGPGGRWGAESRQGVG